MDLHQAMIAFVRSAERGGFSAAARDLSVTQPHVTRAIQQLESRLGARLFHRTTRKLNLTDEGREYLDRCRAILQSIEEADESVGRGARTLRGELRIFAPVSLGRAWIVPRLGEFLARHPELSVKLVLDDRPRDIVEERLDVSVRVGPLEESSHRVRKLGDVERILVASPAFWQRHSEPRTPADLERLPWLIFDGPIRVDQLRLSRGADTRHVKLTGRISTNSSEAIHEALLQGFGACPAPIWLVATDVRQARLTRVLSDWRIIPPLPLHAVYPETRVPTEKVRRFVDWLAFTLHADGVFLD